jgi:hypothetical protein
MSEEIDFNSMNDMEIIMTSKLTLQQKIDETHIIDFIQKKDERYLGVIFDKDTLKLNPEYKEMLKWLTLEIIYQLMFNNLKGDLKYLISFLIQHVKSLYKDVKPHIALKLSREDMLDLLLTNQWIIKQEVVSECYMFFTFVAIDVNDPHVYKCLRFMILNYTYFNIDDLWEHINCLMLNTSTYKMEILKLCIQQQLPLLSSAIIRLYMTRGSEDIHSDLIEILEGLIVSGSFNPSAYWIREIINAGHIGLLNLFTKYQINIKDYLKIEHSDYSKELSEILAKLDISLDDYIRMRCGDITTN